MLGKDKRKEQILNAFLRWTSEGKVPFEMLPLKSKKYGRARNTVASTTWLSSANIYYKGHTEVDS